MTVKSMWCSAPARSDASRHPTGRAWPGRAGRFTDPSWNLGDEIECRAADVTVPGAAAAAAAGASVIYQCLNAPYTDWEARFPPLQRAVIDAAERTGALLVSLENLYGYGPTTGPMTEDLPLAATTVKGRTRALMTQELLDAAKAGRIRFAIGRRRTSSARASPNHPSGASVRERRKGKAGDFVGNPKLPHTYSYVPDIAAGLAILGTDERAIGGTGISGPETVSTKALFETRRQRTGAPGRRSSAPKLAVRALGIFNPTIRELVELTYEFDAPFVLDTTKFQSTFGTAGTPLPTRSGPRWPGTSNATATSPRRNPKRSRRTRIDTDERQEDRRETLRGRPDHGPRADRPAHAGARLSAFHQRF